MKKYYFPYKSIEFFLALIMSISTIGLTFPYGFPLFSIVVGVYFIYFLIKQKIKFRINIGLIILLICVWLYMLGIALSFGSIYPYNIIDIQNIIELVLILLLSGNLKYGSYKKILMYFSLISLFTIPPIAIFSLYKFSLLLNGNLLKFLKLEDGSYPLGTSLMQDYNMYALGMLFGLLGIIYTLKNVKSVIIQIYCYFSIIVILAAIIFSESRRGWLSLPIVFLYLIYIIWIKFLKDTNIGRLKAIVSILILSLLMVFVSLYFPTQYTNQHELNNLQYRFSTLDDGSGSLYLERTNRWEYAGELIENYSLVNLLIGDGFNYIQEYGNQFFTLNGYDYPHNPIISAMHYSGMIGAFCIVILLFIPFFYILHHWQIYGLETFIMYVLCLVFFLVSSNSIFSVNIFWLIILIILTQVSKTELTIINYD